MDKVGDRLFLDDSLTLSSFVPYLNYPGAAKSPPYRKKAFSWEDEEFCCP